MRSTGDHISDHIGHHVRDDGNGGSGGFGCVEVITGARRRRDWSDDAKLAIIAESFTTTTSVSAVARRHGIDKNQLFQWRRQFREGAFERPEQIDFVPVVNDACPNDAAPVVSTCPTADGMAVIEVVVGTITVRVPRSVDEVTLRRVLDAVKALA